MSTNEPGTVTNSLLRLAHGAEPIPTETVERFACMMCFQPNRDSPGGGEEDEYGDFWTYCRACDCWTAHPKLATPTPGAEHGR